LRLNYEPANFGKLVAKVIGKKALFVRNHPGAVEFEPQLSEDLPLVIADSEKLTRVL
jgi:hypothetical protein